MKVIVYQGQDEQFRARLTTDDGAFVEQTKLYHRQADAIAAGSKLAAANGDAEVEVRETIAEVAAREATES